MGPWICVLTLCCVTLGPLQTGAESNRPSVITKYGRLRGTTVKVDTNRSANMFIGVPYAKPPLGSLRFADPEPPEAWGSVKEATEYPPMCMQSAELLHKTYTFRAEMTLQPFSEDCLYLNIYTPADQGSHANLPVMVFIHGGALLMGGAAFYDGSALSAYEDVVLVTIQYRLGILGFLSTGDGQASGNYGFLDQVAALRWIQENIVDFGGDPNSVTIFGQSAGAVSVSAMLVLDLKHGCHFLFRHTMLCPERKLNSIEELTNHRMTRRLQTIKTTLPDDLMNQPTMMTSWILPRRHPLMTSWTNPP